MVQRVGNVVRTDTFVYINIGGVCQAQLRDGVKAVAAHVEPTRHLVLVVLVRLMTFRPDGLVNLPEGESVLSELLPVEQSPGLDV